jgi:hypothetical protein
MCADGSTAIRDGRSISRRHPLAGATPSRASSQPPQKGFFATPTKRRLKRGVFRSVSDLQAAINRFLAEHNQQSQPFISTADPDKNIAAGLSFQMRH